MATPLAFKVPVPRGVVPSSNVTVPVASVPLLVTVATKTTGVPTLVVLAVLVRLVVVMALITVCVKRFDVLPVKLPSPPSTALMVCGLPVIDRDVVEKVATPWLLIVPVPIESNPSSKVTVPVARVAVLDTVAVKVTAVPKGVEGAEEVKPILNVGLTTRTRWLLVSAMKRFPPASTATPSGSSSSAAVAGPPSPL